MASIGDAVLSVSIWISISYKIYVHEFLNFIDRKVNEHHHDNRAHCSKYLYFIFELENQVIAYWFCLKLNNKIIGDTLGAHFSVIINHLNLALAQVHLIGVILIAISRNQNFEVKSARFTLSYSPISKFKHHSLPLNKSVVKNCFRTICFEIKRVLKLNDIKVVRVLTVEQENRYQIILRCGIVFVVIDLFRAVCHI